MRTEKIKDIIIPLMERLSNGEGEMQISEKEWEVLRGYIEFLEEDHKECLRQLGVLRGI